MFRLDDEINAAEKGLLGLLRGEIDKDTEPFKVGIITKLLTSK